MKEIEEIERTIAKITENLNWHVNLLKTIKGFNSVKKRNLEDRAMKKDE